MDAGDDGSDGTYYDVLGVAPTASDEAIRDQYLAVAKVVHPDVGGDPAMFMVLQEAYDTVGDRVRRAEYDRLLVTEGLRRVARAAEQQPAVAAPAQGWGLLRPSTPEQRARGARLAERGILNIHQDSEQRRRARWISVRREAPLMVIAVAIGLILSRCR
ncbi:MAG: J domain-containing protein [Acidimicrobiaceae bacterium]|nr:J domain-containing protein [Ilumatobacter sp.]MCB9381782.1 J domain-containing protein [Acidimicrobiaceae bacterium]